MADTDEKMKDRQNNQNGDAPKEQKTPLTLRIRLVQRHRTTQLKELPPVA